MIRCMTSLCLASALAICMAPIAASAGDAIAKKRAWLENRDNAGFVIAVAHFPCQLKRITQVQSGTVTNGSGRTIPGHSFLEYTYEWKSAVDDMSYQTTLTYFFDDQDDFYSLKTDRTTATLQPFVAAELIVGLVSEAFENNEDNGGKHLGQAFVNVLRNEKDVKKAMEILLDTQI
ncbi:MAG: hypothetical protein SFV23_14410 [Planctomycetaceae bacterium]|nr:hypothetical protein [Planctomycetaceae bacterium]